MSDHTQNKERKRNAKVTTPDAILWPPHACTYITYEHNTNEHIHKEFLFKCSFEIRVWEQYVVYIINIIVPGTVLSCYSHLSLGHSSRNKLIFGTPGSRWLSVWWGIMRVCLRFDFIRKLWGGEEVPANRLSDLCWDKWDETLASMLPPRHVSSPVPSPKQETLQPLVLSCGVVESSALQICFIFYGWKISWVWVSWAERI